MTIELEEDLTFTIRKQVDICLRENLKKTGVVDPVLVQEHADRLLSALKEFGILEPKVVVENGVIKVTALVPTPKVLKELILWRTNEDSRS